MADLKSTKAKSTKAPAGTAELDSLKLEVKELQRDLAALLKKQAELQKACDDCCSASGAANGDYVTKAEWKRINAQIVGRRIRLKY